VIYDITGDTPCTGFILPMREGIMQKMVVISSGSFTSLSTANSLLAGITRKGTKHQNASLLVNFADEFQAKSLLSDYAEHVNIPILAYVDTFSTIKSSYLEDKTVFHTNPDSTAAMVIKNIARNLIEIEAKELITPLEQRELLYWQQNWKKKELDHHSGYSNVDSYSI
jgi:nitrogenase iron protein NifH